MSKQSTREYVRTGWASFAMLVLLAVTVVPSRGDATQRWTRTYGFTSCDMANDVRQTGDGGYIACGVASGNALGLVKTDSLGETLWTRRYKPTDAECCEGCVVLPAANDGYIVAGNVEVYSDCDPEWMYILRTDDKGDSLWAGTFQPDSNSSWTRDMIPTSDGGYVLAGYTTLPSERQSRAVLVKLDSLGNLSWTRTYGGTGNPIIVANSVQQLPDGGFIISGENYGSACDAMLLRTDAQGAELWHRVYGGTGQDVFHNAYFVPGSGFVAIGWTDSYGAGFTDGWLVKTDTAGRRLEQFTYGGHCYDYCRGWPAADGGYVLAGKTSSFGRGGTDAWVVKIDSAGNEQWSQTFGGTGDDQAASAHQTADGGFAVAGQVALESGGYAMYLVKTDQGGLAGIGSEPAPRAPRHEPRPELAIPGVAGQHPLIRYFLPQAGWMNLGVFDASGRAETAIVSRCVTAGWHEAELSLVLSRGAHFLRLVTAHGCSTAKLVTP